MATTLMVPIAVIVVVLLIILFVVVYFLLFGRRPPEDISKQPGGGQPPGLATAELFRFGPDRTGNVKRTLSINAPPQVTGRGARAVKVTADPLPREIPVKPPPGKGIDGIILVVIEPRVQLDTGEDLYVFDPPLQLVIDFTAEDAAAAPHDPKTGRPMLSIVTQYQDPKGQWHWERLATTVTCDATCETGQLTAQLKNLHPNDPISEGFP